MSYRSVYLFLGQPRHVNHIRIFTLNDQNEESNKNFRKTDT